MPVERKLKNVKDAKQAFNADTSLKKLSIGAASVLLGTSFYLDANVKANADTNNVANNNNSNTTTQVDQQAPQKQQLNQQKVVLSDHTNTNSAANSASASSENTTQTKQANQTNQPVAQAADAPSAQATATQPIANDAYQINQEQVTVNNGDSQRRGNINVHISMTMDSSKVKSGDYLDIKLGAPTANGQYYNYSNSTVDGETPITVNGTQVGSIASLGNYPTQYYRITFNDQLAKFANPALQFNLYWKSLTQNGVTLVGYSHDRRYASSTYAPQNDLSIGSRTYTSGIAIPINYISDTGSQVEEHNTTEVKAYIVGDAHLWVVNSDGSQTLTRAPISSEVNVVLGDNLSNDVSVKVMVPINDYFTPIWESNQEVQEQIIHALQKSLEKGTISNQLKGNGQIGLQLNTTNNSSIPTVTVTSSAPKTVGNDQVVTYRLVIDSPNQVVLGGQPITFAIVQTKDNVNIDPASGISNYEQDMATRQSHNSSEPILLPTGQTVYGIHHNGWYWTSPTYVGPNLSNQDLQKYMIDHGAAFVSIHDNGNESNNSGADHDVVLGKATNGMDEGSIHFAVNIGQYAAASSEGQNQGSGTASQTVESNITVNYIDQLTGSSLDSWTKKGDRGTDSGYTTAAEINTLEGKHYTLISDGTNGQSLKYDGQTYTVYFGHATQDATDSKVIQETIHYVLPDGSQAHADYVSGPLTFNRSGKTDLVTNKTSWNAWSPASQTFVAVTSPTVDGYTPDQTEVAAQTVTADSKAPEITVHYTKNSQPTSQPTTQPTSQPTSQPTTQPTSQPTSQPTTQPTSQPTTQPTSQPTTQPTSQPTSQPTTQPTSQPTSQPTTQPTSQPTSQPTTQPTSQPTSQPTTQPTSQPTTQPTSQPTTQPTSQPTEQPSGQPTIPDNPNNGGQNINPGGNGNGNNGGQNINPGGNGNGNNGGSINPGGTNNGNAIGPSTTGNGNEETTTTTTTTTTTGNGQGTSNGNSGYKWVTRAVLVPNKGGNSTLPQTGNEQTRPGILMAIIIAILAMFGISFGTDKRHEKI